MASVSLTSVSKNFAGASVLTDINLAFEDGKFIVIVGPSGCGKSTLLRLIAGLEKPTDGEIAIDGRSVESLHPIERGVAMVFQNYALYPHMNVAENIGFGLKIAKRPKQEIDALVAQAADILKLSSLLKRKPKTLSGGQRQRVAIGRAIVKDPKVFLFDEPLSNLDAELRVEMRLEISQLHKKLGATMLYVTHDQVEAMTLADEIIVMNNGHIEQAGSPLDLYNDPANSFVAAFIGSPKMNFLHATWVRREDREAVIRIQGLARHEFRVPLRMPISDAITSGDRVTLGCRPEHFVIKDSGALAGNVQAIERLGNVTYLYVDTDIAQRVTVEDRSTSTHQVGDCISCIFQAERSYLFSQQGERL